jgi:hypothetical protein
VKSCSSGAGKIAGLLRASSGWHFSRNGGRKMKPKLFGLIVSLVLFGAMPSQASTVTVNYTGTVTAAFDNFGIFGIDAPCCNNPSYVGDSFAATFVFDTSLGSGNTSILPGGIANPNSTTAAFSNQLASHDIDSFSVQGQFGHQGLFGNWSAYDGCGSGCAFGQSSDFNASISSVTVSAVPLPSTLIMFLSSFVGFFFLVHRGTKNRSATFTVA